ncbi:MAG: acyl carrier protein [Christensenellaceae bacterium]|jgi:acyl carrier protein|nr:acyl carrier protein [Christensenellaceae bacterium]MBS6564405.1 acyl carrier protein [Clostridiales bacterium]PWM00946.1 MAG: acyl carrier protein [Selenomonadales bacterium]
MLETVIKVIAEQLSIDESKISPESNLVDDLKADSLDVAALMLELEERYNVEIPDEELGSLKTVADIAAYLEQKTA